VIDTAAIYDRFEAHESTIEPRNSAHLRSRRESRTRGGFQHFDVFYRRGMKPPQQQLWPQFKFREPIS
jgi:hypothetical protein